jgi:thioredoxin-like negative regulator of GroEL
MEELLAMMDGSDSDCNDENKSETSLTLVLFHAHYCKICQRATMQLTRAAREYPSVNFGKVEARVFPEPASDNLRSLGISKFPFVQIFRKGACVASFSTGPTHMFLRKVRDTLDLCLERDEDCWGSFTTDFATEIESNRDARSNLQPELLP